MLDKRTHQLFPDTATTVRLENIQRVQQHGAFAVWVHELVSVHAAHHVVVISSDEERGVGRVQERRWFGRFGGVEAACLLRESLVSRAQQSDLHVIRLPDRAVLDGTFAVVPDLGIVTHMSKHKTKHAGKRRRKQQEEMEARARHGFGFFVRLLVFGTIVVAVIAIAGDDELRASLTSWIRSPDRPWG